MIVSFGDRATEAIFHGERPKASTRLPPQILRVARRKLDMLTAAHVLTDLRVPPGNRLESLKGDLRGMHSIRIPDPRPIVFRWTDAGPAEVRICDYHS